MILPFKPQFIAPIINNIKIHTFRDDLHNRWKADIKIQGATGVRTKQYNQFFESTCTGTQKVFLDASKKQVMIIDEINKEKTILCPQRIDQMALNDGFENTQKFWEWFDKPCYKKIIHWTDFRY